MHSAVAGFPVRSVPLTAEELSPLLEGMTEKTMREHGEEMLATPRLHERHCAVLPPGAPTHPRTRCGETPPVTQVPSLSPQSCLLVLFPPVSSFQQGCSLRSTSSCSYSPSSSSLSLFSCTAEVIRQERWNKRPGTRRRPRQP